ATVRPADQEYSIWIDIREPAHLVEHDEHVSAPLATPQPQASADGMTFFRELARAQAVDDHRHKAPVAKKACPRIIRGVESTAPVELNDCGEWTCAFRPNDSCCGPQQCGELGWVPPVHIPAVDKGVSGEATEQQYSA